MLLLTCFLLLLLLFSNAAGMLPAAAAAARLTLPYHHLAGSRYHLIFRCIKRGWEHDLAGWHVAAQADMIHTSVEHPSLDT